MIGMMDEERERERKRERERAIVMQEAKVKTRHNSRRNSRRACDCCKNSTRREKLFCRCYPLKTLHQIPHVLAKFPN